MLTTGGDTDWETKPDKYWGLGWDSARPWDDEELELGVEVPSAAAAV